MTRIFLCYRSGDDAYAAALLDEKLSGVVGRDNVFRASRSVAPGESYSEAIHAALDRCDTVLVIIGQRWQECFEKRGETATDEDWVRVEIAAALRQRKRIVPVLLSRATRLAVRNLPEDISELAYKQYLKFEHRTMDVDFALLATTLGLSTSKFAQSYEGRHSSGDYSEYLLRREAGKDGSVELDVVRRSRDGVILGRLSGRVDPVDLVQMGVMISDSSLTGETTLVIE